MIHLHRPTDQQIARFIKRNASLTFSYPEVGHSKKTADIPGYDNDRNEEQLGQGSAAFEAAKEAIRQWKMFPGTWARIEPKGVPIREGEVVAMVAKIFGLHWLNTCRIVYTVDENGPVKKFGFAYGTLPGHVEKGEELFQVEMREDDSVWYVIRAFSKPRFWLARLGYPIARMYQRRFVRESKMAMKRAVEQSLEP